MSYIHIEIKKSDQVNGTPATVILTEPIVASHLTLEGYSVTFSGQNNSHPGSGPGDNTQSCIRVNMPLSERQIVTWVSRQDNGPRNNLVLPIESDRASTVHMNVKIPVGVQNIHIPQSFHIHVKNAGDVALASEDANLDWVVHLYFSFKRAALF